MMDRQLYLFMGTCFLIGVALGIDQAYFGLFILNVVAYGCRKTGTWVLTR